MCSSHSSDWRIDCLHVFFIFFPCWVILFVPRIWYLGPLAAHLLPSSVPSHDSGVPDWFDLSIENRHILRLLCFCNNKHLEKPSVSVSLSVTLSAPFPKMTLQRLFLLSHSLILCVLLGSSAFAISSALAAWNVDPWQSFDNPFLQFFLYCSVTSCHLFHCCLFFCFCCCFLIPLRRDVSVFPSERQLQLFQNHRSSWHHLTTSFILFACFSLFACLYTSSAARGGAGSFQK